MGQSSSRSFEIVKLTLFAACISASATAFAYDVRDITVGTTLKAVKLEYGAPDKKEFVANYEVWNYVSNDSQNCKLYFQKNVLVEPVKCVASAQEDSKRGFASAK